MKSSKAIITITLSLLTFVLWSQTYRKPPNLPEYDLKKWHFGFTVGPEFQNCNITNSGEDVSYLFETEDLDKISPTQGTLDGIYYFSEVSSIATGFHVGIVTSYRLGEYFNLRMLPSLSLGEKEFTSKTFVQGKITDGTYIIEPSGTEVYTSVKSTYISLPILVKYKSVRIGNARPYLIAGVNVKYDLATEKDEAIALKKMDAGVEFGLGTDFYMQTFRLGVEIRFGLGLLNMIDQSVIEQDRPYISKSMESIKAKTFTIAFNFE